MSHKGKEKILVRNQSLTSTHPSYTKFKLDYDVVCRQRIAASKKKYDAQFLYELKMQEAMQRSAYDAMRFYRHFVISTLWPPLHTRKEIEYVLSTMFKLSPKQTTRLHELMDTTQY